MIKNQIDCHSEPAFLSRSVPVANRRRFGAPVAAVGTGLAAAGSAFAGPTYVPFGDESIWESIVAGMASQGISIWLLVIPVAMFFLGIGLVFRLVKGFIGSGGR